MFRIASLLIVTLLATSGCLQPSEETPLDTGTQPEEPPTLPEEISWFPASSNGAAGNRFTMAASAGIVALDEPDSPWRIHIYYGEFLQNHTSFEPEVEPLNLVATLGLRGPVVAYRSPQFEMYVSEWDGSQWSHGKLATAGETYSFPSLSSSTDELILGFPAMTSAEGANYVVTRLTDGIPTDLSDAENIRFPTVPINGFGDIAVRNRTVAVTYMLDPSSIEVRASEWESLSSSEKIRLPGPNPLETSPSLYPDLAWNRTGGLSAAITEWPLIGLTNELRPAILHDLQNNHEIYFQTRNMLNIWSNPTGIAVVTTDAQAQYHLGMMHDGQYIETSRSNCKQIAVLPDGITVSLGRSNGEWVSVLGSFPNDVPSCEG